VHSTLELSELNQSVGRLFMAGMPCTELDPETGALIRDYGLGGVILFSRNIEDPCQVASLCRDLQQTAMDAHGTPLFLAVDQEGGRVARLKTPFARFEGNAAIGMDADPEGKAKEFAHVTSREMNLVGLNMNLAPVLDVPQGEPEAHLAGRTFGGDPEKVARLGCTVIEGLQERGVMAVAKHFPGLGKTDVDPHHQLPTIPVPEEEMDRVNLLPFRAAIAAGVAGIMSSHAIYPALDGDRSATLSRRVISGLLREKLGFDGLVITDDLEMGAIDRKWGTANGAVMAFDAGADILLICKDQKKVVASIEMIRDGLIRGKIPLRRLEQSNRRVAEAKARFLKGRRQASLDEVRRYFV
jgi:beta-N-acetylhexosaminidase